VSVVFRGDHLRHPLWDGGWVFPRETRYIRIHTHPRGTGGVEEPADRSAAAVVGAAGARSC